jgi:hypothetical protein
VKMLPRKNVGNKKERRLMAALLMRKVFENG